MKTRRKKASPVQQHFTIVELEDVETVCHVCEAEFLDEEDLKHHVTQVHMNESNGKMICKFCCTILGSSEEFVLHFIFEHLESLTFCVYCFRAFSDPLELEQHELKHCVVDANSVITCSQCPTILSNKLELQNHEYKKHRKCEDGYILNGFFPLLSSFLNIKIDKFIESLSNKTQLVCLQCSYVSLNMTHYIDHLKKSRCRSLVCDKCYNIYKKKVSIVTHMKKSISCHNYVSNENIHAQCRKCDEYFNIEDINTHEEICNVLKCNICQNNFNSMYDLTDHRVNEHQSMISVEVCKYCKKEFVGMKNLKKHIDRLHKNKKLYKYNCVYCGSLYMHPSKLFAHFYSQHKDIKPFTCQICNKDFRIRKQLTIHIKVVHKSVGFVEFDENLHVIFTDTKSEHPVEPKAYEQSTTDASDTDNNEDRQQVNNTVTRRKKKAKNKEIVSTEEDILLQLDNENNSLASQNITESIDANLSKTSNDVNQNDIIEIQKQTESSLLKGSKRKAKLKQRESNRTGLRDSPDQVSDDYEDEPLSSVRKSLLKEKAQKMLIKKRKRGIKDKRARLTCQICNKYCYTVQNYHHHSTLHEKTKLKRCIKCQEYFHSGRELKEHMAISHSSSKLTETLKSLLEKRKTNNPAKKLDGKPGESLKSLLEQRKKSQRMMAQNATINKFRNTIKKVDVVDDCVATITPMSDHGLSVKNFIENFRPEVDNINISNCVTIKAVNDTIVKSPVIKLKQFNHESPVTNDQILKFPVKFKEAPTDYLNAKVNVKLVQQLITKPKLVNMTLNEKIPVIEEKSEEYCNTFADETDYTQYKNDAIPEVAQEVMLQDTEDIPRTRRLEQEIIIPKIPKEHGSVRIGHLLPQAPFYKIVPVSKLLAANNETEKEEEPKDIKLPDGTQLVSVKNPYGHLIPNEHLEQVLQANSNRYYKGKKKNIQLAIAKALRQTKPPLGKRGRKVKKKVD